MTRSHERKPSSTSAGARYLDRDAALDGLRRAAHRAKAVDPRIERVLLFGSLVSGTRTPGSDADLVVVLSSGGSRRMDRVPGLLAAFGRTPLPLDVHAYTREEWDRARARGDALARRATEGLDLLAE